MTKRLVEIDDALLEAAKAATSSNTITETVRRCLEGAVRAADTSAIDRLAAGLAGIEFLDRSDAWR